LLALCGVYSGGLASASPVGRFGLAIPLGRDKRIARRALSLFTMLYSPKVFNALQLSFPYLGFFVFRLSRLQQEKNKTQGENFRPESFYLLQPDVYPVRETYIFYQWFSLMGPFASSKRRGLEKEREDVS